MAFLKESDYTVQLRSEISKIIDPSQQKTKLLKAENMAIGQIRNHIAGRYDCDAIFQRVAEGEAEPTWREYIIMIVIDLALYHAWSGESPNSIPKHRELRYNDALKWLQDIQKGKSADLPEILNDDGESVNDVRIYSLHKPENNRF
jgi:hypothetical protein